MICEGEDIFRPVKEAAIGLEGGQSHAGAVEGNYTGGGVAGEEDCFNTRSWKPVHVENRAAIWRAKLSIAEAAAIRESEGPGGYLHSSSFVSLGRQQKEYSFRTCSVFL